MYTLIFTLINTLIFGGYWCDIPGYQLGRRAVIVMEKALFSLEEFIAKINVNKKKQQQVPPTSLTNHHDMPRKITALIPIVELDTLRGLDYLQSRNIQHRD